MKVHRLSVLALFLLISLTALTFATVHPSTEPTAQDLVPINKTSGLQILQAKHVGNELKLSLKNNYAQRITAYALTIGDGFRITEDLVFAEPPVELGIRPQRTFERSFTLSADELTETVVLQAVVLEDKTGDGDPVICEDIQDNRLGQAVQIRRALRVLEKYADDTPDVEKANTEMVAALNRPEPETLAAIKDIRAISTRNRNGQEALSDNVKEGLIAGRNTVLTKLNEAKASPYKKDYLRRMRVYYETLLNRL